MFNANNNAKAHKAAMLRYKRSKNPVPGRSDADRKYLMRAMNHVSECYLHWLDETDYKELLLLPESHISSAVNDRSMKMLRDWQDTRKDEDGYLIATHDHNLKASNIVTVGTWYRNQEQNLYPLFMPIVSPLPNEDWTAEPLNLAHWRAAIAVLTEVHARWKWVHAVREYWKGDITWSYGGTFGWRMEDCKRLAEDDDQLCVGRAILTHVLIKHLSRRQTTEPDIQCQQ